MKKINFILFAAVSILLTACGGGSADKSNTVSTPEAPIPAAPNAIDNHFTVADLVDLDISADGIPVIVKAPKEAKIIKYAVEHSVVVYGGKFFKMTYSSMDGKVADNINMMRMMATNKEMNTSFNKLESDSPNGFLKSDTKGKLNFIYGVLAGGKTVIITDGMPIDISPDKFTDYTADDIKLMFEAAKGAKAK